MTQEKNESQNCMIFLMFVLIVTSNSSEEAQKGGGRFSYGPPFLRPCPKLDITCWSENIFANPIDKKYFVWNKISQIIKEKTKLFLMQYSKW